MRHPQSLPAINRTHQHKSGAVAEMIGLMPMVRELEARLAADVEFKGGGT